MSEMIQVADVPDQARWVRRYEDGSEKMDVSYDIASSRRPLTVNVSMYSDSWLYIDVDDIDWLVARLSAAQRAILSRAAQDQSSPLTEQESGR